MKFSILLLVSVALIGAANVGASPLQEAKTVSELNQVFHEFLDLLPKDKIVEIVMDYAQNDLEVVLLIMAIQGEGFKNLVKKVESIEDVKHFYAYLYEGGLDIYYAVNKIHEFIGLPPMIPGRLIRSSRRTGGVTGLINSSRRTGGVTGLIADIKEILPTDEIKALYYEKLETSPAFAELIDHLKSPRFQELINALWANEEFQNILEYALEIGIDVKAIMDLLHSMFGLEFPDLPDVVHNF